MTTPATTTDTRVCPSCGEAFPLAEFEFVFWCEASEGMESATDDVCSECARERGESDACFNLMADGSYEAA